jgi:prephenate dehydrogenase
MEHNVFVSKIVGIIGINGHFGQMLKRFFEQLGCSVIGSDTHNPTELSNVQVVNRSHVVIFSTPITATPAIIRSVLPHVRSDQLLMDVTSIKQPAVEAMLESTAQVVGLHPMFRPDVSFVGQTLVVCPARLTDDNWNTWVTEMLTKTRAKIKWSTPAEHDTYMTIVQAMTHLGHLTSALVIVESGISIRESLDFTSPFYRMMLSLMGRLLSQGPDLYTSIIIYNPNTLAMLESRIAIEQRLVRMIREKNHAAFEALFSQAAEYFGSDVTRESNELFVRILSVFNTLYGKNSLTLEFDQSQNKPGLLAKICDVFSCHEINLTGINSAIINGRLQFRISFEEPCDPAAVPKALSEIDAV